VLGRGGKGGALVSYHVRIRGAGQPFRYLRTEGGYGGAPFKEAHAFESLEDARREAAKYPTWREVVEVFFIVKWKPADEQPYFMGKEEFPEFSARQRHAKRFLSRDSALLEYLSWKEKYEPDAPGEGKVVRLVHVIK
jgi:hypothetical protein